MFLGLECVSCIAVFAVSKSFHISSKSNLIKIFIFGWTIPLKTFLFISICVSYWTTKQQVRIQETKLHKILLDSTKLQFRFQREKKANRLRLLKIYFLNILHYFLSRLFSYLLRKYWLTNVLERKWYEMHLGRGKKLFKRALYFH